MKQSPRAPLFFLSLSILILAALISAPADADHKNITRPPSITLKPFVATYMISALGLEGINVTNSLSIGPDTGSGRPYHFKSYSMPVGLLAFKKDETRDEQSEGKLFDKRVQPDKYAFVQMRDNKIRRNVELIFDWQRDEVTNEHKHKNSKWKMYIPRQTVDKLSYQLSLMLKLADKHESRFSFYIADGGKLKEYDFEIMGEERVHTPSGSYKALKIEHRRYQKDRHITLWCAPELNYLPVKIIQDEPGKPTFISTLISYQEGMSHK